jgi:hypothetical protein
LVIDENKANEVQDRVFVFVLACVESNNYFCVLLIYSTAFVAETYGRVIISELNVPLEHKSIKPLSPSQDNTGLFSLFLHNFSSCIFIENISSIQN